MPYQQIEEEIKSLGANKYPRFSLDDLNANIAHVEIVKHISVSGQILRWAVITTQNGYSLTGEPSCSVSSENDNPKIGESVAIENARSKLWPLMGYELKQRLHNS